MAARGLAAGSRFGFGHRIAGDQLGDVAVMARHAQAAGRQRRTFAVAIARGDGFRLGEHPLRLSELPGTERGLDQCLVSRRAEITRGPARSSWATAYSGRGPARLAGRVPGPPDGRVPRAA